MVFSIISLKTPSRHALAAGPVARRIARAAFALAALSCSNDSQPVAVVAAEATGVDPVFEQDDSIYEEIVGEIDAMGALDANGHLDQLVLAEWAQQPDGLSDEQKEFLFDMGDEMTEFQYTVSDGVGSLLGVGVMPSAISRFNRAPTGGRFTGPNARACGDCHDAPQGNAAGDNVNNVLQDPEPAVAGPFNARNTRNINGDAWLELAAIEMTIELQTQLASCKANTRDNSPQTLELAAKGVTFGSLTCSLVDGQARVDYSQVQGVSADLVVRPQGWKGNVPSFRAFSEDAAFGEMGMMSDRFAYVVQGAPLPAADLGSIDVPDVDGDDVSHELSVGDTTAIQFYFASQSRPTTLQQLGAESPSLLTRPLTAEENDRILEGARGFVRVGCAGCHRGTLGVNDPVFRIPDERIAAFRDVELESTPNGYTTRSQIRIDLSSDPVVEEPHLAARDGVYEVPALTDLKRHFLGDHLCDGPKQSTPVDSSFRPLTVPADSVSPTLSVEIDRCEFLTADLWGIGQTAPYMHDGRAGTLLEAIQEHCSTGERVGQGNAACERFGAEPESERGAIVAFLMNQVFRPDPIEAPETGQP
ncbi:MAG TPA: di-heme oxidoredictase family protein [Polyangiaceae bacterium]|nr:di-heme oxidoredictase family protein [Polyangiaceae bacterium]